MSLLVGYMLIWHHNLPWWWYAFATSVYYAEWDLHRRYYGRLRIQILELEDRLTGNDD